MEDKHRARLVAEFTRLLAHELLRVPAVPDDHLDPELVELLELSVAALLGLG
jgi:predicted protein tyrosine phosphatase